MPSDNKQESSKDRRQSVLSGPIKDIKSLNEEFSTRIVQTFGDDHELVPPPDDVIKKRR